MFRRSLRRPPTLAMVATLFATVALTATVNAQPAPQKVLRYSFRIAETGFDPAQVNDLYSRNVISNIFDAPLEYEFLARPVRLKPNTAAGMPEISADYRTLTFRIKPGIYFDDDPVFQGRKRELVAADYVYSIKRHYDPRWKSPNLYLLENAKILGMPALRKQALESKKPFDYDTDVEGLRTLDRYTFQIRLAEPSPRFVHNFADPSYMGAVAREVVEAYGDRIMEKPVGTGAFRLAEWRRSSRMVLEKNPNYREVYYDESPPANDPLAVEAARVNKGKRLPMLDRVEIYVVEENQPRWLAFQNREHDLLEEVPSDFAPIVIPNNELAPHLRKRDIRMVRYSRADVAVSYFGMENPVVGGYTPDKVALRRAISLAIDLDQEIRLVRRGQAIPAQGPIGPEVYGYDATFKSEMSEFDLAKARALLDLYGYVDRDGDGWRDQPDGKPLVLEYATQPDQLSRQLIELWQKNMSAINLRIQFFPAKWPENLKASRTGKLMMWGVGWSAAQPDGDTFLALGYSNNKGQANHARFHLDAYDRLYEKQRVMPDGPERIEVMQEAAKTFVAYMPYKVHVHRVWTDLVHAWVVGYHRNPFKRDFWKLVDIDTQELAKRSR